MPCKSPLPTSFKKIILLNYVCVLHSSLWLQFLLLLSISFQCKFFNVFPPTETKYPEIAFNVKSFGFYIFIMSFHSFSTLIYCLFRKKTSNNHLEFKLLAYTQYFGNNTDVDIWPNHFHIPTRKGDVLSIFFRRHILLERKTQRNMCDTFNNIKSFLFITWCQL